MRVMLLMKASCQRHVQITANPDGSTFSLVSGDTHRFAMPETFGTARLCEDGMLRLVLHREHGRCTGMSGTTGRFTPFEYIYKRKPSVVSQRHVHVRTLAPAALAIVTSTAVQHDVAPPAYMASMSPAGDIAVDASVPPYTVTPAYIPSANIPSANTVV